MGISRNRQKPRARNNSGTIAYNSVDFVVGQEVVCILVLHPLTHSIGQHYGFASMGGSIKNQHLTFLRRRKKYVLKQP